MAFAVGDKIIGRMSHNKDVVREITEVRDTGYTWKYTYSHNGADQDWITENSNDPFLTQGWEKS